MSIKKRVLPLLAVFFLLVGCGSISKHLVPVPEANIEQFQPTETEATVVFLRPSKLGFKIQASVYDITDSTHFIGVSSYPTKIVYKTTPGKKRFMVIGENGDFIEANLAAGKVYYVLVAPRMGVWKARFSLRSIDNIEIKTAKVAEWIQRCTYHENGPKAQAWYEKNAANIEKRKKKYLAVWESRDPLSLPSVEPEYGIDEIR